MGVKIKKVQPTKKSASSKKGRGGGDFSVPIKQSSLKKAATKGCLRPDAANCPAVSGKASPYMYQHGCHAEACRLARRLYYQKWEPEARERRAAAAKREDRAKKRKAAERKAAASVPAKKMR